MPHKKEKVQFATTEDLRQFLLNELSLFLLTVSSEGETDRSQQLLQKKIGEILPITQEKFPEHSMNIMALFSQALLRVAELSDEEFRRQFVVELIPTPKEKVVLEFSELKAEYNLGVKTSKIIESALHNPSSIDSEKLISALSILINKIKRKPVPEVISKLSKCILHIWPAMNVKDRSIIESLFLSAIQAATITDSVRTAQLNIQWHKEKFSIGQTLDAGNTNAGLVHTITTREPSYFEELLYLIPAPAFDALGHALYYGANGKSMTTSELFEQFKEILSPIKDYPAEVIDQMINVFAEARLIQRYKSGKFKLTNRGEKSDTLGYSELLNVRMATMLLNESSQPQEKKDFTTLDQVWDQYEREDKNKAIPVKTIIIKGQERRVFYMGDINFGQKDLDKKSLQTILNALRELPEEERPHQVVISGIVAGSFQFRSKEQRASLAIKSMKKQFQAARLFIDSILQMGLEVSYVMSSEDYEQCRNYLIMVMRNLESWSNPLSDSAKGHVAYWQVNQQQEKDVWDIHFRFQVDVAYPYNLRCGRRLKSADEVRKMRIVSDEYRHLSPEELENTPGVFVRQEEYMLLYDAYQRLINNQPLPKYYSEILQVENIPLPNKVFSDFGIYDGLKLIAELEDNQRVVSLLHHNLALTPSSLRSDPFQSQAKLLGQLGASGQEKPHEIVIFHQDVGAGLNIPNNNGDTLLVSTPGFAKPTLEQRSSKLAPKDRGSRQMFTRSRFPSTGALMSATNPKGLHRMSFYIPELLERAGIVKQRTAIVPLFDIHGASVSSRMDYFLNFMDIVVKEILPNYPTAFIFGGDGIESRNYPGMPNEHELLGLTTMDHQETFLLWSLMTSLQQGRPLNDLPSNLKNIIQVGVVPGNHELNSQGKFTGYSYTNLLASKMSMLLESVGKQDVVKNYEAIQTGQGDYFRHPSGFAPDVGGYGLWFAHEFGGSANAGPEIFQAESMMQGLGNYFHNVHIGITGHYHQQQFLIVNGKLMVIQKSFTGPSTFEWYRGLASGPGAGILYVAGDKAPMYETISRKMLAQWKIKDGPFSDQALADTNPKWVTDKDFDPSIHGLLTDPMGSHSAQQKRILSEVHRIKSGVISRMG